MEKTAATLTTDFFLVCVVAFIIGGGQVFPILVFMGFEFCRVFNNCFLRILFGSRFGFCYIQKTHLRFFLLKKNQCGLAVNALIG